MEPEARFRRISLDIILNLPRDLVDASLDIDIYLCRSNRRNGARRPQFNSTPPCIDVAINA
jgi:hypothetical protein